MDLTRPVPYHDPHDTTQYEIENFTLVDPSPPTLADVFKDEEEAAAAEEPLNIQVVPDDTMEVLLQRLATQNFVKFEEFGTCLSIQPEEPLPFSCYGCHLAREIFHKNGTYAVKLELHRRLGTLCHAFLRIKCENATNAGHSSISRNSDPMFDFTGKSMEEINNFLLQYCTNLYLLGYKIALNPLSDYHYTLKTALEWIEELIEDFSAVDEFADRDVNEMPDVETQAGLSTGNAVVAGNFTLSEQHERVSNTQLSDLSDYFMMPLEKAAKELNFCPTAVKKICRRSGLNRWPNRKVKSIVNRISILKKTFDSGDANARKRARDEIARLHEEMVECCGGIAPTGIDWNKI